MQKPYKTHIFFEKPRIPKFYPAFFVSPPCSVPQGLFKTYLGMFKAPLFIFFAKLNILVLGSPQLKANLYLLEKRNIIKNARFLGQISFILRPLFLSKC